MNSLSMRFDSISYNSLKVRHDMALFLHRGAAKLKVREAIRRLDSNTLGEPELERTELIKVLHDFLEGVVVAGLSKDTLRAYYNSLRRFFAYMDEAGYCPNLYNIEELFILWGRSVVEEVRRGALSLVSARHFVGKAAVCIGHVAEVAPKTLISKCRLSSGSGGGSKNSPSNQEFILTSREFCEDIKGLVKCLSVDAINSDLPVALTCEASKYILYNYPFAGRVGNITALKGVNVADLRRIPSNDISRRALINLRVLCEAFIFIYYTAGNVSSVKNISYASRRSTYSIGGQKYVGYKARKGGKVAYSIRSEHYEWFAEYLEFRNFVIGLYPSDLLFPIVRNGLENQDYSLSHTTLRTLMRNLSRPFVPPSILRKSTLNAALQNTEDPLLVSSLGQHSETTFFRSYLMPNHFVASKEWAEFFLSVTSRVNALVSGHCISAEAVKSEHYHNSAPVPDCTNPAGCLFCEQYRGVGSLDYIWSLLSYKVLKGIEYAASKARLLTQDITPLEGVIARIIEISESFRKDVKNGEAIYAEASSRINEGYYHPDWNGFIDLVDSDE
ncbi:hypothetical protein NG726_02470 [Pseudomonas sp. MOB-449]|nr:hypothetical protein [Pseudomonas sp. MOB-449]